MSVETAREAAREGDGKFGTQQLAGSGMPDLNLSDGQKERLAFDVVLKGLYEQERLIQEKLHAVHLARVASLLNEDFPGLKAFKAELEADGEGFSPWVGVAEIDSDNDVDAGTLGDELMQNGYSEAMQDWIDGSELVNFDVAEHLNAGIVAVQADLVEQRDALLKVDYSPQAIREHFEMRGRSDEIAHLDDDQLAEVGDWAMCNDNTWEQFSDSIDEAVSAVGHGGV